MGIHPRAWLVWTAFATALAMSVSNPLYLLLLILSSRLVIRSLSTSRRQLAISLFPFGLAVIAVSALFNLLFNHGGQTVVFMLPSSWPLIGGALTLESAVAGASNGMTLLSLLAIFITFSQAVGPAELVRLFPDVLKDLGLVLLIAMTYIPETKAHLLRIREAQAIRGHTVHGWRDLRPLVIPLMVGGLERSYAVAEATVARGYGAIQDSAHPERHRLFSLFGLLFLLGGWLISIWQPTAGIALVLLGVLLLVAVWRQNRRFSLRTRYRSQPWRRRDMLLLVLYSLSLLLLWLPISFLTRGSLVYQPYPQLSWPPFQLWIGFIMLMPALPVIMARD